MARVQIPEPEAYAFEVELPIMLAHIKRRLGGGIQIRGPLRRVSANPDERNRFQQVRL